jgi:hypothetical protein
MTNYPQVITMTRNVGVTLSDLAYQVWIAIPHGQRSRIISQFLTENADALSKLKHEKRRFTKFKATAEENIEKAFREALRREETDET